VTTVPQTRYTLVGDGYVAYQTVGAGTLDAINLAGWISDVQAQWQQPQMARFLNRMASFTRLICFDRRGHGMSDPIDLNDLTLDQWMEDVRAVMDAAGSERAALLGWSEAGALAILYAATHPERTSALVLVNGRASGLRHDDYPWGFPERVLDKAVTNFERTFANPDLDDSTFFTAVPNPEDRTGFLELMRRAISPRMAGRMWRTSLQMDVRDVLGAVRVPTLIVHRSGNQYTWPGHGRYLAEHIPGAKYVELPGSEHFPWHGNQDEILDEVEEFLTGVRPTHTADRVLATVLLTDIVGSTERAAALGDRRWRELLDRHDAQIARQLDRFDGRKVSNVGRGDGVLATFDGPARAVRCARAIVDAVSALGVDVRAGLHTGEIERRGEDVGGIGVHIADRIASLAGPCEVLVSRTVVDLVVGSDLVFEDRGSHSLKGIPNEWQVYAVER
jgi:pimeloyl-ACP methyl ester carboxylesterase/class 3 adenylate cyclase